MEAFNAGLRLFADIKLIFRTVPVAKSAARTLRTDLAQTASTILTCSDDLENGDFAVDEIINNYVAVHRATREVPVSKLAPNKQAILRGSSYYLEYLHKLSQEEFGPIQDLHNELSEELSTRTSGSTEDIDTGTVVTDFIRTWSMLFATAWKNWRENSTEKFGDLLKTATDGCPTSFPMSILHSLQRWSTLQELPDPDSVTLDSWESFGTQILQEDISTSTTSATTNKATVGAKRSKSLEQSSKKTKPEEDEVVLIDSSSEEEDNELYTAQESQKKQFSIGCNITSRRHGKSYTWKSSRYLPGRAFIDLKIYKDLRALKAEKDPMNAWRLADFRCKSIVMNPMNPRQANKTYAALKELKKCLLEEAEQYPDVEKGCQGK